jgi:C1A family cysteine protease
VNRHLGTGRDRASRLDWKYRPRASRAGRLPDAIDLRRHFPPVYDQRHLNSCSANALAGALRYDELKGGRRGLPEPSRLFIYFNERRLAGVVRRDVPVALRDGYRALAKFGACPEPMWPYDPRRFRRPPVAACYQAGRRRVAIEYYRIRRDLAQLRACLAERYPFVFGMAVHKSMFGRDVRRSGRIPVPRHDDKLVGGHAVVAVGYLHRERLFVIRNSWGAGWGDDGYGYLPYAFVTSPALAWDFWTLRRIA